MVMKFEENDSKKAVTKNQRFCDWYHVDILAITKGKK